MKSHLSIVKALTAFAFLAVSANSQASNEQDWPREIESGRSTITLYQPDVESLTNNKMEARAAVSVVTKENPTPVFGAVWLNCRISTDLDERTIELIDVKVESAKFPDIDESKVQQYTNILEEEIPQWELTMSLDELLASMEGDANSGTGNENFNNNPPEIIFATTPSALILIDGEPTYKRLENSDFEYVENTPFFVVRHMRTGRFYLKGGKFWYSSTDLNDRWSTILSPPSNLEALARESMENNEENQDEQDDFNVENTNVAPELIIRTTPSELIQSNGEPQYASVENTSLLFMTNTDDDIIMDINNQEYYTLISGRWYKTKSLNSNNWAYVAPDQLPVDFAKIPQDAEIANVRSSVYGTDEAREAVLENQIPQTATINRNEARVEVGYDGDPQFEDIRGTNMRYAINTNKSVLFVQGRYYCCDNAVWFESYNPYGPWIVSTYIPEEIRLIPPDYPVYNVRYVYIYDYTPDVVYMGYTPGYMHCYTYRGCVYYGTGYYYRPWYGNYYYPRHYTYGFRVRYNPYTGWGFTYGEYYGGPYDWMGFGWHSDYYSYWSPIGYRYAHPYHYYHHYNDYDRAYKRGYYHGYYDAHHDYNHTNNVYGSRRSSSYNAYQYRSNGVSRSGSSTYDARTGQRVSVNQTNTRQARVSSNPNNVYSDRSGNVYRRNDDGNWQERRSGQWQNQDRNVNEARTQTMSTRQRQAYTGTGTSTRSNDQNRNNTRTETNNQTEPERRSQTETQTRTQEQNRTQTETRTNRSQETRQSGNSNNQDVNNRSNTQQNTDRQNNSNNNGSQRTQENKQTQQNNQQSNQNSQQTRQSRDNNRSSQGNTRTSTDTKTETRSSSGRTDTKTNTKSTDNDKKSSGNTRSSGRSSKGRSN
jgi:hypothetical protein